MKKQLIIFFAFLVFATSVFPEEIAILEDGTKVILYDDHTWAVLEDNGLSQSQMVDKNKQYLRPGIGAAEQEIINACEMYEQGWTYTMPSPKSAKAAWGVNDGRTTWYYGWWYNTKTKQYSETMPKKSASGLYLGNGQNNSNSWRNGGSPSRPNVYMFLLSKSGGSYY